MVRLISCFAFLLTSALLTGCSGEMHSHDNTALQLLEEPHQDGNTFACLSCHALEEPSADGITRPGHPIGDAATRPSYKNGQVLSLLEAVNSCRSEWMAAPKWSADDASWLLLEEFLLQEAPSEQSPALAFEQVAPPGELTGGDAAVGRETFNRTCVVCHGLDAIGSERAPGIAGTRLSADTIATRVRTSGNSSSPLYPGLTGGIMPFWSQDRLSDAELRDLIAYLLASEKPDNPKPTPSDELNIGGERSCESTHPMVGKTATLVTRFHGVSGTATLVDDCHLRIDDFNYDGTGIDVRIYTGLGGNYVDGDAISADMLNAEGYSQESFILTLPESVSLDSFDGVSVWCVAVATSFGDGLF